MFENEEERQRGDTIYEEWKNVIRGANAFGNGKSNPIHIFSAKELKRATKNYDQCRHFQLASDFDFYKGSLEDHLISIKKYRHEVWGLNDIIKDQCWNHK